ncbi:hypothetical protein KKF25_03310, partial [Patescibacteria group bacterium]|nr:hypothetical protein [Patescibacteria group bacterium]
MKKRLLIVGLAALFMAMGCAGPKVQTYGDFESQRNFFAKDRKVAVEEEVYYYHDWKFELEGEKKRAKMEGEPDLSPEYLKLAETLKQEITKQLEGKGFIIVPQDDGVLRLKIIG